MGNTKNAENKAWNKAAWGAGRAGFMAHRAAILAQLAEGWPITAVHAAYRDRIGIGYRQFSRYVAAARNGEADRESDPRALSKPRSPPAAKLVRPNKEATQPTKRGFHFDPTDIGGKDLI